MTQDTSVRNLSVGDGNANTKKLTVGHGFRFARVLIFVGLLYGMDRTPLNADKIVAHLHLGTFGAFLLACTALLVLWWFSKVLLGLAVLLLGLMHLAFEKSGRRFFRL
jgi:hypothetical protein